MRKDDPRLRPGVLVRGKQVGPLGRRTDEEIVGYLVNPNTKVPGYAPRGWPLGFNWGLIAKQSCIHGQEAFWDNTTQGPISEEDFIKLFNMPTSALWLLVSYFDDMEYLSEGFAPPRTPKKRRGRRHSMRSGL